MLTFDPGHISTYVRSVAVGNHGLYRTDARTQSTPIYRERVKQHQAVAAHDCGRAFNLRFLCAVPLRGLDFQACRPTCMHQAPEQHSVGASWCERPWRPLARLVLPPRSGTLKPVSSSIRRLFVWPCSLERCHSDFNGCIFLYICFLVSPPPVDPPHPSPNHPPHRKNEGLLLDRDPELSKVASCLALVLSST